MLNSLSTGLVVTNYFLVEHRYDDYFRNLPTSDVDQSNITTSSFDLSWSTDIEGSSIAEGEMNQCLGILLTWC